MNESVKKSLEKSKNVLEEKRKSVKQKICIKKRHTHVYNNCYELRSRAINKMQKIQKNLFQRRWTYYGSKKTTQHFKDQGLFQFIM